MKLGLFGRKTRCELPHRPVDLRRILADKLGRKAFGPEAERFFDLVEQANPQDKRSK